MAKSRWKAPPGTARSSQYRCLGPWPRRRTLGPRSMRILIVDDEEVLRDVLDVVLRREGFEVAMASSGEEALSVLDQDENIDLVILDIMLPGISGIDTLRAVRISNPSLPVIVITAFSSIDGAIEAMKHGAFHYIPKPFKNEEVILTVNKALEQRRLSKENRSEERRVGKECRSRGAP